MNHYYEIPHINALLLLCTTLLYKESLNELVAGIPAFRAADLDSRVTLSL